MLAAISVAQPHEREDGKTKASRKRKSVPEWPMSSTTPRAAVGSAGSTADTGRRYPPLAPGKAPSGSAIRASISAALAQAGLKAGELRLVGHNPGDEIATWALKAKPDLLVMGSLGFGANRHAAMGSVATRVASKCRTALLLVREK